MTEFLIKKPPVGGQLDLGQTVAGAQPTAPKPDVEVDPKAEELGLVGKALMAISKVPGMAAKLGYGAAKLGYSGAVKTIAGTGEFLKSEGAPEVLAGLGVALGTSPSGVQSAGARVGEQFIQARAQQAKQKLASGQVAVEEKKAATAEAREKRMGEERPMKKDIQGRLRYSDGEKELVFPDVEPKEKSFAPEILRERIEGLLETKLKAQTDRLISWEPESEEALIQELVNIRKETGEFYPTSDAANLEAMYRFYFLRLRAGGFSEDEARETAIKRVKYDLQF